ncbi:cbb3-type cytochrome c oxidase subunit 3 [Thiohalophilus sp.]|uniref:cbb3-type cytochrome c oxidase subunit 3 n=1 Tax=Thiohalophilus sp. TaxID=3028392 RepID=UPI0039748582
MYDWIKSMVYSGDAKTFLLLLFFITFVGIILYVFTNRKRSRRLESYKNIPFEDDDVGHRKDTDNE